MTKTTLTPTDKARTALHTWITLRRQADIAHLRGKVAYSNDDDRITINFEDDIPSFTITTKDYRTLLNELETLDTIRPT